MPFEAYASVAITSDEDEFSSVAGTPVAVTGICSGVFSRDILIGVGVQSYTIAPLPVSIVVCKFTTFGSPYKGSARYGYPIRHSM